ALDSLATIKHVDFPIKGAEKFVASGEVETLAEEVVGDDADSTEVEVVATVASTAYSDEAYIQHVQHEAKIVKDQIERMTRNTDKDVRAFAEEHLEKVKEVFTLAGGQEDAHAHH